MYRKGQKVHDKVAFKDYNQKPLMLPMDLETLIPANHIIGVISRAIDLKKSRVETLTFQHGPFYNFLTSLS